jgi:guanylate kinase
MPISISPIVILPKKPPPPAWGESSTNVSLTTRLDQASRPGQQAQKYVFVPEASFDRLTNKMAALESMQVTSNST